VAIIQLDRIEQLVKVSNMFLIRKNRLSLQADRTGNIICDFRYDLEIMCSVILKDQIKVSGSKCQPHWYHNSDISMV
jgi:hypothetical protein